MPGMKFLALALLLASAQDESKPVVDSAQLDCPWPKHSHYKIPWRGWCETRAGHDFVRGIGIVYNVPSNDELAVRLLAEAGIRVVRCEVGWGDVAWEEDRRSDEPRLRKQLRLFKQHGMRPILLLNAHEGVPCPNRFFGRRLAEDAPKGARKIRLDNVEGIVAGRTGLNGLTGYWAAEALVTSVDPATGECTLSKPLPKDLPKGEVPMATLKYPPLHAVGTKEFDETAAGFARYALFMARIAREEGVDDFDLEIWNELTFGTKFLDARNYLPDLPKAPKDFLHEGGTCWELARRVVEAVKKDHPKVRCIWGFSNTTFFHTAIEKLPPGIDAQSYHPYGTSTRKLAEQEPHRDQPKLNLEGFTPKVEVRLPEGVASTFIQTESVMRLIEPGARGRKPPGVERFRHYITEHGVLAKECGVVKPDEAWALKAKGALRSYCLWLHKGIDVLTYFAAYDGDPMEFGILPTNLPKLPVDSKFEDVATLPLLSIRALTREFAGAVPLAETRPLEGRVAPVSGEAPVFAGDAAHPPLLPRDVFAFLPFQVKPGRWAIVLYLATWDSVRPPGILYFRVRISGLSGPAGVERYLDLLREEPVPVQVVKEGKDFLEVELGVTDVPRVLTIAR